MSKIISAAAEGLPTRRRALATLAAAGAAVSLPRLAKADASPDALLIAFAAQVEALGAVCAAAMFRFCELDDEFDKTDIGTRPPQPKSAKRDSVVREDGPDGSMTLRLVPIEPDPAEIERERQETEAWAAWETKRDELHERLGLPAAEKVYDDARDHFGDAIEKLTPMEPTTLTGLAAKARAALLIDPDGTDNLDDQEKALWASVLRAVVTIGGAA